MMDKPENSSYSTISNFHGVAIWYGPSNGSVDSVFQWQGPSWCWLSTPDVGRRTFFVMGASGYNSGNGVQSYPVFQRPVL